MPVGGAYGLMMYYFLMSYGNLFALVTSQIPHYQNKPFLELD